MTRATNRLAVAVLIAAVALPACGSGDDTSTPTTTSASTAPTTAAGATTTTLSPADAALAIVVWPTVSSGMRYRSPISVARSFALDYLHFVNPAVGAFRQGDTRSGEVPVRTTTEGGGAGPETTVLVREVDGSWWVLGSSTPNLDLIEPAALTEISSPVRLRGTSTAFEGTVNVSIRQDDGTEPLVEDTLSGGSNGRMGPFDASFSFASPTSRGGAIVLYTISAANGQVAEAAVTRVRLTGA